MITEDYVSFEVAKILKEKGFDGNVSVYYNELGSTILSCNPISKNLIKCPTLQMTMRWLREVHHIFIDIDYDTIEFGDEPYFTLIINMNTMNYYRGNNLPVNSATYEGAADAAIKYCLENLI